MLKVLGNVIRQIYTFAQKSYCLQSILYTIEEESFYS